MRYTWSVRAADPEAARAVYAQSGAVVLGDRARPDSLGVQPAAGALSGAADRVASLDALRGLMALAVVVYHLGVWTHAFAGNVRSTVIVLGIYSVEGFFIISGFCFFHLYGGAQLSRAEWWRFHLKRFFRIAPLYYLALALTLAFDPYGLPFTWGRLIENLTLSFGLFHPNHSMVLGGWSIGIEYVFYLMLPALLWLGRNSAALYLCALLFIVWGLPYSFGKIEAAEEVRRFHVYVEIPNHAASFLLGAIVAQLRARSTFRLPALAVIGALAALCWWAAATQPPVIDHFEVMVGSARLKYIALCFAVVLLCAFAAPRPRPWLRPFAWLGDASYSVYLMHPLAWLAVGRWLPSDAPALGVCVGLLATLGLAALTHRFVEAPALAFGSRLAGPRRP